VRDGIWIFGGSLLMLLVAVLYVLLRLDILFFPWWSPWRSIYDWVRNDRTKKCKSQEDVI